MLVWLGLDRCKTLRALTALAWLLCLGKTAAAFDLRWGTAPAGGVWPMLGHAILADLAKSNPGIRGATLPIGGAGNLIAIQRGKTNVAFSFSITAWEAWQGRGYFARTGRLDKIRHLAVLFPVCSQIVVPRESGIKKIVQLRGRRVTPGPKGTAVSGVSRLILAQYGLSFQDLVLRHLSFAEAGRQFSDGQIDCIFFGAMVYPAPPIVNAASRRPIRLLPLAPRVVERLTAAKQGLLAFTLPKGSYPGVNYAVPGIASQVVLVARRDLPNPVAYAIVRCLDRNFARYARMISALRLGGRGSLAADIGVPLHRGALQYYREAEIPVGLGAPR